MFPAVSTQPSHVVGLRLRSVIPEVNPAAVLAAQPKANCIAEWVIHYPEQVERDARVPVLVAFPVVRQREVVLFSKPTDVVDARIRPARPPAFGPLNQ